jgi:hypothetical protein
MEKGIPKYRFVGALTLICILVTSCSSPKDLSERPLYSVYKFKEDDNIQRTVFIEQLNLAKVPVPVHPLVFTLDMYVRLGKAVYSISVHSIGADLPDRDEIILIIDGKTISLTAAGPVKQYHSGDTETELVAFFLDQETFKGLRYCEALEIHYDQHVIPIPREGLGAIWNFLKD